MHRLPSPAGRRSLVCAALAALVAIGGACASDPAATTAPGPVDSPDLAAGGTAEGRALWVNRFEYNSAAKIAEIMQNAASANFNVVYFQVRGAGDAYYRSSLEPCAVGLCGRLGGTPTWDPLEVAVQEAHARGLQLHVWLNALAGWGSGSQSTCDALKESDPGNPRHWLLAHPEWAVVDQNGATQGCPNSQEYTYMSPGRAGVRTHIARVAADIVRRYAVEGVHLDRIRYPGRAWSYDTESVTAFGKDPLAYPTEWNDFRRGLVDKTVKETFDSVTAVRPTVVLSAAVWQIYIDKWGWNSSQGYHDYFQNPAAWVTGGYLDVAAPMTYYTTKDPYCSFTDWACLHDDHVPRLQTNGGRHVYIGIGAKNGAAEVDRQIKYGRSKGVKGFSIYSYNSAVSASLFSALARGAFRTKVGVPTMPWK